MQHLHESQTYAPNRLKDAIFSEVRKNDIELSQHTNSQLNSTMFYVSSMRLTYHGFLKVKRIFTAHSIPIESDLKNKHHMGMSMLDSPYYITAARFIVFSETDAMVIKLSGGVIPFLDNCFQRRMAKLEGKT